MEGLSEAEAGPGSVAIATFGDVDPTELLDSGSDLLVVLAEVRDPGNLGTILRTARAAGAGGVLFTKGTPDVYNPAGVRRSGGAPFPRARAREGTGPRVFAPVVARD